MSFHSNPPRKLAIAATINAATYRGTRVSLSASVSHQTRQEDWCADDLFLSNLRTTPSGARDGVDSSDTHVGATVAQLVYARPLGNPQISHSSCAACSPESAPFESNSRAPPARPSPRQVESNAPSACQHTKYRAQYWLSTAFARSDEFALELATKARHRRDHRRRGVSRHAGLSNCSCRAKAVKRTDAITSSSVHKSTARREQPRESHDGVNSFDPRGRDGDSICCRT
jgi:hypothetical protein